ncbi:MAG: hypothetical protein ABI718_04630 [Acidobacteriota bacterium]
MTRHRRQTALFFAAVTVSLLAPAANGTKNGPAEVTVGRYHLQSNVWVCLHQRLMHNARFGSRAPLSLSGERLDRWKEAVAAYRSFLGERSPVFDSELRAIDSALARAEGDELPRSIPPALVQALHVAMPLYREAQWPSDDRYNRFWIAFARPLLESTETELIAAHARAFGTPFSKEILVDLTPFAWQVGAYTTGDAKMVHVIISSTLPGNQEFGALESLMHEPSHGIVDEESGAIGADLARTARELGMKPPPNLWHAVMFYTCGELTRRALEERGVTYVPYMIRTGMYDRGFRGFRQPLESHWQAWLDGKISETEALRRILKDTSSDK